MRRLIVRTSVATIITGTIGVTGALLCAALVTVQAQPPSTTVTAEQLLAGSARPDAVVDVAGDYSGRRHSPLTQVTPQNVGRLAHQWTFQTGTLGMFETTPIVHDGVLYPHRSQQLRLGGRRAGPAARSGATAASCRKILEVCCGPVNRGFAALGNRLFMTHARRPPRSRSTREPGRSSSTWCSTTTRRATPRRWRRSSSRTP